MTAIIELDVKQGLRNHRTVSVEVKELYSHEIVTDKALLLSLEPRGLRVVALPIAESLVPSPSAVACPAVLKADDVRYEAVGEADGTGLQGTMGDAGCMQVAERKEHEVALRLQHIVGHSAVFVLEHVGPCVWKVLEHATEPMLRSKVMKMVHGDISLELPGLEDGIGLIEQLKGSELPLHDGLTASTRVVFVNLDGCRECGSPLSKVSQIDLIDGRIPARVYQARFHVGSKELEQSLPPLFKLFCASLA